MEYSKSWQYHDEASSDHSNSSLQQARIFPVNPKEHRVLVRLWFKCICPSLPAILRPRLGGEYTAGLVRQGPIDFSAVPCVQIESPRIPNSITQKTIRSMLDDLCDRAGHDPVCIRFSQGTAKKLSGCEAASDDVPEESQDSKRYRMNLIRPSSKSRMGASLGLLCSEKIIATLGGYILVGGVKYMLTSEHFITESQQPSNNDGNDDDLETITSPSRFHLNVLEGDLKQTKRELDDEYDSLSKKEFGDREISSEHFGDPTLLSSDMREMMEAIKDVTTLLDQVRKPPLEYTVGTVFKRSIQPTITAIAKSVADQARLEGQESMATYYMDWALCKLNSQTAKSGENRHRYRSYQDAIADKSIHEEENAGHLGEYCHATCEVEAGVDVYYVGQGSRHRNGRVTIPKLVSRDSSETLDWAIVSSDGQELPYSAVTGDSGAWVFRQYDNTLMGQVHSYSKGQVLFTPIDIIFDALRNVCEMDVSLPSCSQDPGQSGIATLVQPLCAKPVRPLATALEFLKPSCRVGPAISLGIRPSDCPLSKTRFPAFKDTPISQGTRITEPEYTCASIPSPSRPPQPELSDSSDCLPKARNTLRARKGTKFFKSPIDIQKVPCKSLGADKPSGSETQQLALSGYSTNSRDHSALSDTSLKGGLHIKLATNVRTSNWPPSVRSKVSRMRFKDWPSRLDLPLDIRLLDLILWWMHLTATEGINGTFSSHSTYPFIPLTLRTYSRGPYRAQKFETMHTAARKR